MYKKHCSRPRVSFSLIRNLSLMGFMLILLLPLFAVPEYSPGQLLFKTDSPVVISEGKTGLSDFDGYLSQFGIKQVQPIKGMPSDRYFKVSLSSMPDIQAMKSLSFAGIEYIEPNYLRKLHAIPNDPLYPRQLLHLSSIPSAWKYTTGNRQIIVAVIDSGLLINHPDIAANVYVNEGEIPDNGIDDDGNGYIDDWCGWDFVDAPEMADVGLGDFVEQDNDVEDENFHGTHVSGIIGAQGNNGIGISGVAWNVRIMPLRAGFRTAEAGYLQDDDAAAAIIYAADNGAHVINMSWGDPNYSAIIADACDYAYYKGVTLVASSGNDGSRGLSYPAKLSNVISVGSVNSAKVLSSFSSYGPELDLVAPGELVLSTYKDTDEDMYMEMSGTSMSAPFVSGSIALLLSLVPGLSPAEVRARLLTATDDIDTPGYDIRTGHGLLNARKLMENLDPPFVEIEYPIDQSSISGTTDIRGSVFGEDFARYTLMYTPLPIDGQVQWQDCREHTMQPTYHTVEVIDGVMGEFYVPGYFAEGTYLIRLQYEKRQNNLMKYNYFRTVTVDRSAPQIRPESLHSFTRYDRSDLRHYIGAVFDEKVQTQINIFDSNGVEHTVFGSVVDSLQIWPLPTDLAPGNIDISIKATNHGNLSHQFSRLYTDFCHISYESIPNYGFKHKPVGAARVPLNRWHDFNGNGKAEYLAMDIPESGYGQVRAYEPQAGQHLQTHLFAEKFWPLDIGDTNGGGMEVLLLQSEVGKLWDTKPQGSYPSPDSLVFSDSGITGGIIADYDNNGSIDLLLVKNLPAARVIQLYKRDSEGNMSPQKTTLQNTSPTDMRNTFVPTIIAEDFNQDNIVDILTADTDGDIMIYNVTGSTPTAEVIWHHRLPVGNAYQLASGDFNGDGQQDFIVGGYNTDIINTNLNFWHFEAFTFVDTTFVSMAAIQFNNVGSQNAITTMDMDGDGQDEIILGISPSLYILKYVGGRLKPIFMGDSYGNYRLAAWQDENDVQRLLTNYRVSADSLIAVEWEADAPYTGPPLPVNFCARATGPDSVQLSWLSQGATSHRIFCKDAEEQVIIFDNVIGDSFLMTGLQEAQLYFFAITAVDPAFSPPESNLTVWREATPLPVPQIMELAMVGTRELRAIFNQQMDSSVLNPGLYTLSHDLGKPLSVNSVAQQHGVQLRFREPFPAIDSLFTLNIQGLTGPSGIAPDTLQYSFPWVQDIEPPQISEVRILSGDKSVEIVFNEPINTDTASYLGNYKLNCPANDPDNSIAHIAVAEDRVVLGFTSALRYSNEAYFIEVQRVTDLFGNQISPLHNLARFALRDIDDLSDLVVFPNPLRRAQDAEIIFMNFPPQKKGRIAIYDAAGALVYKTDIGPFNPANNHITWRWNARNHDGRRISSGVYFYIIEMDDERCRGKFAVIN